MKVKGKRLGLTLLAALCALNVFLLAATLPSGRTKVRAADDGTVAVNTHLSDGDLEYLYDSAATEGEKMMSVSGTQTLTEVFGLGTKTGIDGRINAGDKDEFGNPTKVGEFKKDTDGSYRMHFDWYGATLSKQQLTFASPVDVSSVQGDLSIGIYLHTGAESSFQNALNTYGMKLYAADDTGAVAEGFLIPATTKQDTWTNLVIPHSQLALLADASGKLSGLNIGSRFHWADPNAPGRPDTTKGASQGYIKIKYVGVTKYPATLTKVFGETTVDNEPTRDMYRAISEVDDADAEGGKAYFFNANWYGVVKSKNCIIFDNPVRVEDISDLIFRIYVDADVKDPYFASETAANGNAFMFYPLGAVGEKGEGVMVTNALPQKQYGDFRIPYNQAKKLAGSDGYIRGIQIGARYNWGHIKDLVLGGDTSYGNYHPTTSGTDDNLLLKIDSVRYTPYVADEYLTHGDGDVDNTLPSTLTETNGITDDKHDGLHYALNKFDVRVVSDAGATDGYALKMHMFAWSFSRSKYPVVFRTPLDVADADGLVVRIKLHVSASQPYASKPFGLFFYDMDSTGAVSEMYTVPRETKQDEWVQIYIGKEDLVRLAGEDGLLKGLQFASQLDIGVDKETYNNDAPYFMLDYVVASENAEMTFTDGTETVKTQTAPTFFPSSEYFFIPEKQGYLFLGWKNGSEYYDFASALSGDVTLTADWIEAESDLTAYYGLYKSAGGGKYLSVTADGVDLSSVAETYHYWGIGTDGRLYVVKGDEQTVVDLSSDYVKVESATVTYRTRIPSDPTRKALVEKGTAAVAPEITRNGYRLTGWADAEGNAYDFSTLVTEDIELTAVYSAVEAENAERFIGTYYDAASGKKIELLADHAAKITADGTVGERTYYILENNVLAFETEDDFEEGTVLAARLIFGGTEYIRLTQYAVTFDLDGAEGSIAPQTVNAQNGYLATKPADPAREGYVFEGWYLSDGTAFDFNKMVTESVSLYAHWSAAEPVAPPADDKKGCGSAEIPAGAGALAAVGAAVAAILLGKRKS